MTIPGGLVWGSNAGPCAERVARNRLRPGMSDDLAGNGRRLKVVRQHVDVRSPGFLSQIEEGKLSLGVWWSGGTVLRMIQDR